jgi:hypothetical protein
MQTQVSLGRSHLFTRPPLFTNTYLPSLPSTTSSSTLSLNPPSTCTPFATHSIAATSSTLLRPRFAFFSNPSTHSRAPVHSAPFTGSHSPSSSPNWIHTQSHRAMRCTARPRAGLPGGESNGNRPSMSAYSKTPSAHASVARPSYGWPSRISGAA